MTGIEAGMRQIIYLLDKKEGKGMEQESKIRWSGWDIVDRIGKGGYGTVYELRREVVGDIERCALKVITIPKDSNEIEYMRSEGMDDESISNTLHAQLGDIAREYKLMMKMRENPNIVHCDDFRYTRHEEDLGYDIYIKMELLIPLMKALHMVETEENIIRLGKELCNALTACQKFNIIHRDIKPQNIFLSPEGHFKLGDFGIAKAMEHTMQATAIGTPAFMAPEVAGMRPYGSTADIYSLGLVMYWLLNERRLPFAPLPPTPLTPAVNEEAIVRRCSGEQIPPPKHGSNALKSVILKACAFDPQKRYQSAREFRDALNGIELPVEKPVEQASAVRDTSIFPDSEESTEVVENCEFANETDAPTVLQGTSPTNIPDGNYRIKFSPNERQDKIKDTVHTATPKPPTVHANEQAGNSGSRSSITKNKGNARKGLMILKAILVGFAVAIPFFAIYLASEIGLFTTSKPEKTTETEHITTLQTIDIQKSLDGQWNGGNYKISVYDERHIGIELSEDFFIDSDNQDAEGIAIRLYHDLEKDSYYNIGFVLQAGKLYGSTAYYSNGTRMRANDPESFDWEVNNGVMTLDLVASSNMDDTMLDIENVQIIHLVPNGEPISVYSTFEPEPEEIETMPDSIEEYETESTYAEALEAQRILVDEWDSGGIRISIFDETHISVDLKDDFFTSPESHTQDECIVVKLYHNLEKNNCYNISFSYQDGKLLAMASYLKNGSTEYDYGPDFYWRDDKDTVHAKLIAGDKIPWDMFDFDAIQVIHHTADDTPEIRTTPEIPSTPAKIQFQHFEGPDDVNGGKITEKAIIVGLDAEGTPIWTHLSDVKYEMWQSYRIESVGYVNDKYYYTDDNTLVILDAATGNVLKKVIGFGGVTDGFVDYDGTMYFCCHMGPYFIELSTEGKIIHKIEDVGGTFDWAYEIYRDGDSVYVVFDLGPDPYRQEDYIFEINLKNYTYTLTNPDEPTV